MSRHTGGLLALLVGAGVLYVPVRVLVEYVEPVLLVLVVALTLIGLVLMELGWRAMRGGTPQ